MRAVHKCKKVTPGMCHDVCTVCSDQFTTSEKILSGCLAPGGPNDGKAYDDYCEARNCLVHIFAMVIRRDGLSAKATDAAVRVRSSTLPLPLTATRTF